MCHRPGPIGPFDNIIHLTDENFSDQIAASNFYVLFVKDR